MYLKWFQKEKTVDKEENGRRWQWILFFSGFVKKEEPQTADIRKTRES